MRRFVCYVLAAAALGCSWFNDDKGVFVNKSDDYLDATERRGLVIPEDLSGTRVGDPFPIPPTPEQPNPEFFPQRPPRPDAIYANDNREEVRIQRLGERSWLALPESPFTVWPKVKQFLAENGVTIANEIGSHGRLDTEWLTIENQSYRDVIRLLLRDARDEAGVTTGRDRLRIRIEQGLRERTSEVHVRHENDALGAPAPEDLVDLNSVASRLTKAENDMLNELGAYIAAKVAEQTVSMVAQEISSGAKSLITRDANGDPALLLHLDFERAWATLGQALARAEMKVNEEDRGAGRYEVTVTEDFLEGEEKPGFFKRMFSFGRGDKGYRLRIQLRSANDDDNMYVVSVLDAQARPADRELSQLLLNMIREYAS